MRAVRPKTRWFVLVGNPSQTVEKLEKLENADTTAGKGWESRASKRFDAGVGRKEGWRPKRLVAALKRQRFDKRLRLRQEPQASPQRPVTLSPRWGRPH